VVSAKQRSRRVAPRALDTTSVPWAERFRVAGEHFVVLSLPARDAPSWKLTAAEKSVLAAVFAGLSNGAIARARKTTAGTVANQVTAVLRKVGARSRTELALRCGAMSSLDRDTPPGAGPCAPA